jgi:diamine N-acetyltransferase
MTLFPRGGWGQRMTMMRVELREISEETVYAVTQLKVAAKQEQFVATNAVSLAEALFSPRAWFRAIYADDELVGFVMLADDTLLEPRPVPCEVAVWRLMVDHRFQGRGIGRECMLQIIDHVKEKQGVDLFYTSYAPGDGDPSNFYKRLGFAPNGLMDEDEIVLEFEL